jgi:transcriptional regulator with XRE-family HTH domain
MTLGKAICSARKRALLTQAKLAEKLGIHEATLRRWETGESLPLASNMQKICEVLECFKEELWDGLAKREIKVRVVLRESDEEVGNATMDLSKGAPLLQLVELGPHKTGINLVFGPEKSLREVCEELLTHEAKIKSAHAAIYGNS